MTACKLSKAGHTLASIQQALSSGPSPLITPHTILLGHSLECDLAALRIRHPLCIDTALLFSHPRGPPYKPGLKWLAQRWLGKDIQGGEKGHDSEEDARTCVELLKMKMANGTYRACPRIEITPDEAKDPTSEPFSITPNPFLSG